MKKLLLAAPLFALLTACTSMQPAIDTAPSSVFNLVDPSQVDAVKYEKDFADCAAIANQNEVSVKDKVTDAARTAASKASFGVLGSSKSSQADRGATLRKCLTGRGYTVLR
jgi:hypothetical protein